MTTNTIKINCSIRCPKCNMKFTGVATVDEGGRIAEQIIDCSKSFGGCGVKFAIRGAVEIHTTVAALDFG